MMRTLLTVALTTGLLFGLAGLQVAESTAADGVDGDNDGKGTPIPIKCINPQRHSQVMEALAEQSKQGAIVPIFGGSFVQGWGRGRNRPAWDKFLAPVNAVNCGIGGESSWGTLWRLRNGAIDGYQAKAVVLFSTGANDVANE